jgi:hypothetical protein
MRLADEIIAVLDDPKRMWSHALRQLSPDARRLFLTLTVLPKPVSADVLQIAYTAQGVDRSESFLDSLRSIEDSFVNIRKPWGTVRSVEFRNPSLQDFALGYIDENLDSLDTILDSPVFYEQITTIFTLAMAYSEVIYNAKDRSMKPGKSKYVGIKKWVERRGVNLVLTAIDLLDSEDGELYSYAGRSRLSQLIEIMDNYGTPDVASTSEKVKKVVTQAVNPYSKRTADITVSLLRKPSQRLIMDRLAGGNAAAIARENVLDKDDWKYGILSKLDVILDLDRDDSWESWGISYQEYARELTEILSDSHDDEDLRDAIRELNSITDMLEIDMSEEIAKLEARRETVSSQESDYDEQDSLAPSRPDKNSGDASQQLERIFSSLL